MMKKYAVLLLVISGITCSVKNVKSEQLETQAVVVHEDSNKDLKDSAESSEAFVAQAPVARNKDISDALEYLKFYRNRLDGIVLAIENAASQVTPEQDGLEAAMKLDHVIIDYVHKFVGAETVELSEAVYNDVLQALADSQILSQKDLIANPIKGVQDYVAYMNRTYTTMFIAVIMSLNDHYELTDKAIAPYVQPFGTQVATQDVVVPAAA